VLIFAATLAISVVVCSMLCASSPVCSNTISSRANCDSCRHPTEGRRRLSRGSH
jgi:hypothetical protein